MGKCHRAGNRRVAAQLASVGVATLGGGLVRGSSGMCHTSPSARSRSASGGPQVSGAYSAGGVVPPDHRIDDPPGLFDGVFPREEGRVAPDGVPQQALVGRHLVGDVMAGEQFGRLARERLARALGPHAERDHDIGAELEADVIALVRPLLAENGERRAAQLDQHPRSR